MEFFQILGKCADQDLLTILGVVRAVINVLMFVIPILLIGLGIVDLSKAVVSSDEKKTKEAQKMFGTRVVYALVIFLIPTLVSALFNLLPAAVFGSGMNGYTWRDCWNEAK